MKKFLPYIIIFIALVGLFSPAGKASAEGACFNPRGESVSSLQTKEDCLKINDATRQKNFDECAAAVPFETSAGKFPDVQACAKYFSVNYWVEGVAPTPTTPCTDKDPITGLPTPAGCTPVPASGSAGQSPFDVAVGKNTCVLSSWATGTLEGCILQFVYWTFYTLGAWLLAIAASFFNFFIRITLGSELLKSDFISTAWGVVRDLSNIFFILILLYIAIKIILDIGGSEAKKMIVRVIIMALLINFSMFMTQVIIDSSNILALVFYNKINTVDKKSANPNLAASLIDTATGYKDLAGGLTQSFNPVYKLPSEFFTDAGIIKIPGRPPITGPVSLGTLIGITVIAGAIMLFAAYALFISALSFLGRLIELFVLIIFSPFAFMSWSLPYLEGIDYLGWKSWLSRLLKTAFMAPVFMFFLYFIFLLLGKDMFTDSLKNGKGTVNTLLSIIIPALVILLLLIKATSFAKKGAGQFGEAMIKGGTMVGGLALGAATGGAAFALRAGIGGAGGYTANKLASGANKFGTTRFGNAIGANKLASGLTSIGAAAQRSSFDVRGTGLGKAFSSATGLKLGEAQKGGIEQARKDKVEKRMKRADGLKVREDEKLKQKLNKTEQDLQGLLSANAKELSDLDKFIEKKRQELRDATAQFGAGTDQAKMAGVELQNVKDRKKSLKDGKTYAGDKVWNAVTRKAVAGTANAKDYTSVNAGTYVDANGARLARTINHLEDVEIRDRKQDVEDENRRRMVAFAKRTSNWRHWGAANKEAKHKIIMGSKVESKKDH